MKRIAVVSLGVLAIALMACEGDNPSEPGGTLPTVTGLTVDWASSEGNSIVLNWTAVTGETIDGYEVYFSATEGGTWSEVGDVTGTTFTHTATSAGYYSVRAYEGDNFSEAYATAVNTMPYVSASVTIYDNNAPEQYDSGFIFNYSGGETGQASSPSFVQDMYCYDYSKGDGDAGFSSGDYGTFGNGNETWFYAAGGTYGYCPEYGTDWWNHGQLEASDDVIFAILHDGLYAKIIIEDIFPEETSANGTGVQFHYELPYEDGITVFTTDSN
ncbi:hypothetical protein JW921_02885 [Candidatus Fermentibacterales bacterium]|nr:hypothetical protein [Candidatus Fermentibacterales bacterium]